MLNFIGTLKLVQAGKPFVDHDTGVTTPAKYKHYFQLEDEDTGVKTVVILNSKEDYSKLIDQEVVGRVQLFPQERGAFYVSLVGLNDVRSKK